MTLAEPERALAAPRPRRAAAGAFAYIVPGCLRALCAGHTCAQRSRSPIDLPFALEEKTKKMEPSGRSDWCPSLSLKEAQGGSALDDHCASFDPRMSVGRYSSDPFLAFGGERSSEHPPGLSSLHPAGAPAPSRPGEGGLCPATEVGGLVSVSAAGTHPGLGVGAVQLGRARISLVKELSTDKRLGNRPPAGRTVWRGGLGTPPTLVLQAGSRSGAPRHPGGPCGPPDF